VRQQGLVQPRIAGRYRSSADKVTGKVTGAVKPRHRHPEFLAFLRQVARDETADTLNSTTRTQAGANRCAR
jgi:hypothetical protein